MTLIRQATEDDLDALAPLFDLYRQFYRRAADLRAARAYLHARLAHRESVIFVAIVGKDLAGFAQLYPGFSSLGLSRTWILNDLYVLEPYRRRKIAHALIEAAHDYTRASGAASISLETQPTNKAAQALYESFGYRLEQGFLLYYLSLA